MIWKTPGPSAAFASFVVGKFGGQRQLIGYDKESLGGWDIEDAADTLIAELGDMGGKGGVIVVSGATSGKKGQRKR